MLLGQSPFRGDDEDEIFDAILEDEPLYPIHMPKDSVSILCVPAFLLFPFHRNRRGSRRELTFFPSSHRQKLLTKDPARRLGATEADAAEIKSHLFFKDTNWDDVFHKRIPSPFYPAIVRFPPSAPSALLTDLLVYRLRLRTCPTCTSSPSLCMTEWRLTPSTPYSDSEFTSEQPTLTPVHSTLSTQDQGEFAGFSWTADWIGK